MRIALVSIWFSEPMGYAENCLPKALAKLGHDVHLITTNAQVYCDEGFYESTYEPFLGPRFGATGIIPHDGYTLHRLPFAKLGHQKRIDGLASRLAELKPDVVQTFDAFCQSTLEVALVQPFIGFRLFLESHIHASVFSQSQMRESLRRRLKWWVAQNIVSPVIASRTTLCYPISTDAAEIAEAAFRLPKTKLKISSLGVDTDLFTPVETTEQAEAREALRARLGFSASDVVCIYTGRFSAGKDPMCLARAIDLMADSTPDVRGLFVGDGETAEAIAGCRGCVVHEFVPTRDLPAFYRAADIGVWPRQESTSQLDAAACGLPIILSNRVQVTERVASNGLLYEEGDPMALAAAIVELVSPAVRSRLGIAGRAKVESDFSWAAIARSRVDDYEKGRA